MNARKIVLTMSVGIVVAGTLALLQVGNSGSPPTAARNDPSPNPADRKSNTREATKLPPAAPVGDRTTVSATARNPKPPATVDAAEQPIRPDLARAARSRRETAGQKLPPPGPEDVAARAMALQPTEAELMAMSSAEIVDVIIASPLQVSIYLSSDDRPQARLSRLASTHLGVNVLLSRPDAASALLAAYQTYSNALVDPDAEDVLSGDSGFAFATMETLLAADSVLDQLYVAGQLPAVLDTVLLTLERQVEFDATQPEPLFGDSLRGYAATVVGLSLESLQDPAFLEWLGDDGRAGIFIERSPTRAEVAAILELAVSSDFRGDASAPRD